MKIHQHYAGHMTKTAAMPIYGKNNLKSSFSRLIATITNRVIKMLRVGGLSALSLFLGFTGVNIIFLIFALKHRSWVLVRTAVLTCTHNLRGSSNKF